MDRPWYSFVNEDNRAERGVLLDGAYKKVVCITGSGERVVALLDAPDVLQFHAVDINPSANYLLEFKLAALDAWGVDTYLTGCGFRGEADALQAGQIESALDRLSPEVRSYWNERTVWLRSGIAHCGHFEHWLARLRPFVRFYLGPGFYRCFGKEDETNHSFPERRWRLLLKLFSQRWTYRLLGNRDPAFISRDGNPALIADALRDTVSKKRISQSFVFHYMFRGNLDALPSNQLPPSVRPEVLTRILEKKVSASRSVHFHTGDLIEVIEGWDEDDHSDTIFLLSDILSFTDFEYLLRFCRLLSGDNIAVVFRSFLRHTVSQTQLSALRTEFRSVVDISEADRTLMYRVYHIEI